MDIYSPLSVQVCAVPTRRTFTTLCYEHQNPMCHRWTQRPYYPAFKRRSIGGSNPSGGVPGGIAFHLREMVTRRSCGNSVPEPTTVSMLGGDYRHPRTERRRAATRCESQPETRSRVERVHRAKTPRRDVTPRGVRPVRWRNCCATQRSGADVQPSTVCCLPNNSRLWEPEPLPMGSIVGKPMEQNVLHCTNGSPLETRGQIRATGLQWHVAPWPNGKAYGVAYIGRLRRDKPLCGETGHLPDGSNPAHLSSRFKSGRGRTQ